MGQMNSKLTPREFKDLHRMTEFNDQEVAEWYRSFMKEFPTGRITLARFKDIYRKEFPRGDPSEFANQVFRTFDTNKDNTIDFREFMCGLNASNRGTMDQRLRWAFALYDLDGDGFITKHEMEEMLTAVRRMFESPGNLQPPDKSLTPQKQTEIIFRKMDRDGDDKLSLEEFLVGMKSDLSFTEVLLGAPK